MNLLNDLGFDLPSKRQELKERFEREFKEAKTPAELIQAYGKYAGNLEALLDIIEVERSL